jgi:hypothetical protein
LSFKSLPAKVSVGKEDKVFLNSITVTEDKSTFKHSALIEVSLSPESAKCLKQCMLSFYLQY